MNVSSFYWKLYVSSFLAKCLSAFVIPAGLQSAGCKYLTKHHLKHPSSSLKNPKALIDYSQKIDDVYENLEEYNATKKRKVLIVFDDMIANMEVNKKLTPMLTELFSRRRKLKISLVFISQSNFKVPKTIRLKVTHYFIMKIPNKTELLQIASSQLSDIAFKDSMKL